MTGFLRLGEQDIFSPITVERSRALLSGQPGLGIEVDREKLVRAAIELPKLGPL
jgi:L-alanine-DL-glutamate epimerase-like enolase superfamily enzyme